MERRPRKTAATERGRFRTEEQDGLEKDDMEGSSEKDDMEGSSIVL